MESACSSRPILKVCSKKKRRVSETSIISRANIGLVSTEAIKQDDVIMEYVGHVCLPDECPGRLQRGALQPYCVLYNGLGQNLLCIDARRQGSDARFARR